MAVRDTTSKAANSKDVKVFDVAKPGNTPPSESSRPTIVGHRPIAADPMVNVKVTTDMTDPLTAPEIPKKTSSGTVGEKTIAPLTDAEKNETTAAPTEPSLPVIPTSPTADAEKPKPAAAISDVAPAETPPKAVEKPEEKSEEKSETAATEGKLDEAKPAEDDALKTAHIEELIEQKKYYVSIGQNHTAGGSGNAFIVGIVLGILVVVGLAAAWDAGYIDLGVKAPFDFITDKAP